jgi:hypothetical protein
VKIVRRSKFSGAIGASSAADRAVAPEMPSLSARLAPRPATTGKVYFRRHQALRRRGRAFSEMNRIPLRLEMP